MQTLKEQLFEKVNAALQSTTNPDEPPTTSAAGRITSDALAGRWRSILDRCALRQGIVNCLPNYPVLCCTSTATEEWVTRATGEYG